MHFLRKSTTVKVRIGPAVDATDGVTPKTGLTLAAADQAELLKNNGASTVDISGRTMLTVIGCDGWYDLLLPATDIDTLGQLDIVIQDSSLMVPIFKSFTVMEQQAWDSMFGSDKLQVDTVKISGDSVAADNLESDYDGTGLNRSNSTIGTATNVTNAVDILQAAADKVWTTATRTLTSFGTLVADIWNDSISEPSAGAPPATPTRGIFQNWLWMHFRNKGTLNKTTGEAKIYNNAGTVLAKGTDSDDGTTFTKGKLGAP